ncbi:MAG: hydrogenase maturation protease [Caldimicrobium sp.]
MAKILLLGLGNILLRDEGLGVKVVEKLKSLYHFPKEVSLLEGETGAFYLLPYLEEAEYLLVIDAIKGENKPGTLYFLNLNEFSESLLEKISLHETNFLDLLNVLKFKGKSFREIWLAGIEPKAIDPGLDISIEVEENIEKLINLILLKLKDWGIAYSLKERAVK